MIVTKKAPKPLKTPVMITKDRYELWYSKPLLLGTINQDKNMWVTADGKKFISSRDALDYLALLHELGTNIETAPDDIKEMAASQVYRSRAHKSYKGRGSRSFKKTAGGAVQLPPGMTLDQLKDLVEMADKLRGFIEPVSKLSVVKGKKDDRVDQVQEAEQGSQKSANGK